MLIIPEKINFWNQDFDHIQEEREVFDDVRDGNSGSRTLNRMSIWAFIQKLSKSTSKMHSISKIKNANVPVLSEKKNIKSRDF